MITLSTHQLIIIGFIVAGVIFGFITFIRMLMEKYNKLEKKYEDVLIERMPNPFGQRNDADILRRRIASYEKMFNDVEEVLSKPVDINDIKILCSKLFWLHNTGKTTKEVDVILKAWKKDVVMNKPNNNPFTGRVTLDPGFIMIPHDVVIQRLEP